MEKNNICLNIFENINKSNNRIDETLRQVYSKKRLLELTSKEFKILILLLNNPNQVISRKTLLEKVWGFYHYGMSRAVDIEIRRLRKKIESDPGNPKHILTKWGEGYYFKINGI